MNRPCKEPRCPYLAAYPNPRCPMHTRAKQAASGPSAYDAVYRRNRAAVLAESRSCVYCGAYATTVDHRLPVAQGGSNDIDNLLPCCAPCNAKRGAKLGNVRRWGYRTNPKGTIR